MGSRPPPPPSPLRGVLILGVLLLVLESLAGTYRINEPLLGRPLYSVPCSPLPDPVADELKRDCGIFAPEVWPIVNQRVAAYYTYRALPLARRAVQLLVGFMGFLHLVFSSRRNAAQKVVRGFRFDEADLRLWLVALPLTALTVAGLVLEAYTDRMPLSSGALQDMSVWGPVLAKEKRAIPHALYELALEARNNGSLVFGMMLCRRAGILVTLLGTWFLPPPSPASAPKPKRKRKTESRPV